MFQLCILSWLESNVEDELYKLLILSLFGGGIKDEMDYVVYFIPTQRGDFKDKKEGDPFYLGSPSPVYLYDIYAFGSSPYWFAPVSPALQSHRKTSTMFTIGIKKSNCNHPLLLISCSLRAVIAKPGIMVAMQNIHVSGSHISPKTVLITA